MKKFLSFAASALVTASFLDALYCSGLGRPIPWVRDAFMAVAGATCYHLLIRNWKRL